MPLVTLDRVDVRLSGVEVLSRVSLALREGESWAVLGGNGAGKSTLLRLLRGDEQPTPETRAGRRYRIGGQSTESPIGARERIALVSPEQQDTYRRREWDMPAEQAIRSGFGGEVWSDGALSAAEERRVEELCEQLEIAHLRPRSVVTLSNGELRRVLLARALVSRPALLLLDEPCDGLDADSRAAFLRTLSRLAHRGPPLVLATHRYEEIVPAIDRVALLHAGSVVAQGEREEMFALLSSPMWKAEGDPAAVELQGKRTAPRAATPTSTPTATGIPTPAGRKARAVQRTGGRTVVELQGVEVRLDGNPVLRDVGWTVRRGEHWAVVGPNGAGKSTLLRLVAGDEQAMPGGRVLRLGLEPSAGVDPLRARVAMVSPELQARFRADIPAEEVVLSGFTGSIGIDFAPRPPQLREARRAMQRFEAEGLWGRGFLTCSYGEQRRLLFARALVRRPRLLLLDEPLNGLDPGARGTVARALVALAREGVTLLMATHHRAELPPVVSHELELRGGRVAYAGSPR
ncbi:MAG: ATP-binding cassette domain-containing protein [Deltaproteobacteria bacterium]|nr:ATP-binding cassette domain-containing protein [Deltaproteobacteria bacterium]